MKSSQSGFSGFVAKLLGFLFAGVMVAIVAGLAVFLYFPEELQKPPASEVTERPLPTEEYEQELTHFHIPGQDLPDPARSPSMCVQCHGYFCHTESAELRSFYNMHTFYMACETCHVRLEGRSDVVFTWHVASGGSPDAPPDVPAGDFSARIVPVAAGMPLDAYPHVDLAREYMLQEQTLTPEEKKRMQEKLMGHLSEKAVGCVECHKVNGYLDFSRLGYQPERAAALARVEIVKLVNTYDEFFIPTMFDPRGGGRKQ